MCERPTYKYCEVQLSHRNGNCGIRLLHLPVHYLKADEWQENNLGAKKLFDDAGVVVDLDPVIARISKSMIHR